MSWHDLPTERQSLLEINRKLDRVIDLLELVVEAIAAAPVPATIVLTIGGEPMSAVTLTGTQTVEVAVAVGGVEGNVLTGDTLDPGATVTVSDGSIATAVLSADQTSVLVSALGVAGTADVTVNGTSGGVTLTDFGGPLVVTTEAAVDAPATIVLTPGAPQGS